MIQRRDDAHLTIEAFAELFLGDLDRDFASEPGIEGFVYLAHTADAQEAENPIRS